MQERTARAVGDTAVGAARHDAVGHLDETSEAGRHLRIGAERTTTRVDRDALAETHRCSQEQFLVGVRRMQFRDVDLVRPYASTIGSDGGRRSIGQGAASDALTVDAVVDAPDPHRT